VERLFISKDKKRKKKKKKEKKKKEGAESVLFFQFLLFGFL
jgi:hypothetical protein